jgi:hypothetical protein
MNSSLQKKMAAGNVARGRKDTTVCKLGPPPLLVVHDNINLNAKSKGLTQENEQGVAVLHKRKNLVFQEEEWLERKAGLSLV